MPKMPDTPVFAEPTEKHPIKLADGTVHAGSVFLAAAIDHPRIEAGAYSYASAHTPPDDWAAHLAPYLYPASPEKLRIGKFCQIADGVTFITSSANHRYDGISSFPFAIFGGGEMAGRPSMPDGSQAKDTVIGNDCWIGQGARIMPGAQLGHGVIVGAGAVVSGTVPSYSIVAGNPGQVRRVRFTPEDVQQLLQTAWWDWPIEKILAHEAEICGGDVGALARAAVGPF
ncbi:Streptogramin acetyltransferase [Sulfitobacter noctilucicola]|uniref:Virginiamycin A acetyltransferase n=1 Tax=Sulfitobacter noctilucicola TaxID=1342301 RepID=A0A7W6Q2L0_9RHOB|nr:CatB-related O-acetyltransferase [Sulfitobacter noctilucicola]KIN65967.1 Streptogramin acetyltransferase [Sulfitobacter noctilucicola]MBB4173195.1 virginiamycin A acetyltransferase [Sulfitobacter noctilucicola]